METGKIIGGSQKNHIRKKVSKLDENGQRVCPTTGKIFPSKGEANVLELHLLPPMSEVNVPVYFVHDDPLDRDSQYIFEPIPLARMKERQWSAACCLVQRRKSGKVYVRVMNPTNSEIVLHGGTPLGTWEHMTEEQGKRVAPLTFDYGQIMSVSRARGSEEDSREEETKGSDEKKEDTDHATYEELREKVYDHCDHLTEEQRRLLFKLLLRFRYMFRKTPGRTDVVKHVINTGNHLPIRGARYRQSETEREVIREHVKEMVDMGVVRPSRSPWGASVVLAPKKDGKLRFCVDYRKLNEITVKDVYPLPRIDATLDQLGGCCYFTALDLTSGFWQVDLDDVDAAKTAFLTPDGLYEFTAMPFGLSNAPATFQRLMDQVLGNRRFEYALVYLDDVMIHSKTFEEHLVHLESVLSCLQEASLACKLKKCSIAQNSTVYLGHVVSGRGIEPEPAKLQAVKELVPPRDVKEIRMFLGFVGYYRKFIQNFSAVAKPLNELLRKNVEWKWTAEQQDSWEALRTALVEAPILQMPDYSKRFTIRTDASYRGLGACLLQGEGENRHPIAYASRSLKPAETRYTATEIECLGMKWAVGVFRPYIHGRRFTLETDHIALKWLKTVQHTNGRLIRTALELQQYEMDIIHRPGVQMYDADALSRLRRDRTEATEAENQALVASAFEYTEYYGAGSNDELQKGHDEPDGPCHDTLELLSLEKRLAQRHGDRCIDETTPTPCIGSILGQDDSVDNGAENSELLSRIAEERDKDSHYSTLFQYLSKATPEETQMTARIRNDLSKFVVRNGHLYRVEQLYRGGRAQAGQVRYLLWIPQSLRAEVLFACHDHLLSGGHLGVNKTFARLRERYYWTGMFRSVEAWCKSCAACASRKDPTNIRAPVHPLPVPTEPFEMVSVDVCGPFREAHHTKNRYVIVYCDHLTRWVETVPVRRNDSLVVARVLVERIMCRHGAPRVLLSDRGHPFLSAVAREVYRLLRVKKVSTAAYRPQTNGLVERFNRTLAHMLSMYVNSKHEDWDRYLPYVTFAYNTTPHQGTKESPFFLLYGRQARLPIDVMLLPPLDDNPRSTSAYCQELVEGLRTAHRFSRESLLRQKQQLENQRGPGHRMPVFNVGDQVLVKTPALPSNEGLSKKLTNTWAGPFEILSKIGAHTYRVSGAGTDGRAVNANRLKYYFESEHPEVEETDYADFFTSAGEPAPSEGNRTIAPTPEESQLPPGDGDSLRTMFPPVRT